MFLLVGINGAKPLWMKFDMDGAKSTLSRLGATTLGLNSSHQTNRQLSVSLQIGSVTFPGVALEIQPSDGCIEPAEGSFAAVLDEDFLGDHMLWIDTVHKQVWISPLGLADSTEPMSTSVQARNRHKR